MLHISQPAKENVPCPDSTAGHAQRFLSLHGAVQNLFRVGRQFAQIDESPTLAITILRDLADSDSSLRRARYNRPLRAQTTPVRPS